MTRKLLTLFMLIAGSQAFAAYTLVNHNAGEIFSVFDDGSFSLGYPFFKDCHSHPEPRVIRGTLPHYDLLDQASLIFFSGPPHWPDPHATTQPKELFIILARVGAPKTQTAFVCQVTHKPFLRFFSYTSIDSHVIDSGLPEDALYANVVDEQTIEVLTGRGKKTYFSLPKQWRQA